MFSTQDNLAHVVSDMQAAAFKVPLYSAVNVTAELFSRSNDNLLSVSHNPEDKQFFSEAAKRFNLALDKLAVTQYAEALGGRKVGAEAYIKGAKLDLSQAIVNWLNQVSPSAAIDQMHGVQIRDHILTNGGEDLAEALSEAMQGVLKKKKIGNAAGRH